MNESGIRVMVIEDEPNDRWLIEREISRAMPEAKISMVTSAGSLETVLQECRCDAVVLDFSLGWGDGISVMKSLKSRCADLPIVMFSGRALHQEAIEAMRLGLDEFVYKAPEQFQYLPVAIRNVIGLARQRQQVREAERLAVVGRLASIVAHEINNPLSAISNLLFLVEMDAGMSEATKQYLRLVKEQLVHIEDITKRTLGMHRQLEEMRPVSLCDLVEDVLFLYRRRIQANGIQLKTDLRATMPVMAYAGELRQVLANLIQNAIDATPKEGSIRVRVRNSRSWAAGLAHGVSVLVCDSGYGITLQQQKRLFEPFFTTKGEHGTGLGLWISKGIIEKHGGQIELKSRTEKGRSGTCVRTFFPRVEDSVALRTDG